MAERQGKCINFGLCSKADSREIMPVAGGGDFSCPECGKALNEAVGAAGGSGRGAGSGAGGKKALAIGVLGLVLLAGGAYKFLAEPDKGDKVADVTDTGGVQNQDTKIVPPEQKRPAIPPEQTIVPPDPTRQPIVPPKTPPRRPPVAPPPVAPPPPEPVEEPEPEPPVSREKSASGTMSARLLSAINTRTASQGDTFTAKLEDGPYRGGILSGSIKKLKKGRKNVELELEFDKLNGKAIPVGLDLVDISNANGVKGVDDENHQITGRSSKKKVALVSAAGAVVGGVIGKIRGGNKGALIGAGAGAGAGFLVSMKLMTRATDVDLQPGSHLVLRETGR